MTRLPAVVTVPPPIEPPPGVCQRCVCVTGSHATSALCGDPSGGGCGPIAGGGGRVGGGGGAKPRPSAGGRPRTTPRLLCPGFLTKFVSMAKLELLTSDVGI